MSLFNGFAQIFNTPLFYWIITACFNRFSCFTFNFCFFVFLFFFFLDAIGKYLLIIDSFLTFSDNLFVLLILVVSFLSNLIFDEVICVVSYNFLVIHRINPRLEHLYFLFWYIFLLTPVRPSIA